MAQNNIDIEALVNSHLAGDSQIPENHPKNETTIPIVKRSSGGYLQPTDISSEELIKQFLPETPETKTLLDSQPIVKPETFGQGVLRNVARSGQGILGVLGGLPGSIATGIAEGAGYLAHKFPVIPKAPEGVNEDEWSKGFIDPVVDPDKLFSPGLTISGIKEHIANIGNAVGIPKDYWKPKTPGEEMAQDYVESVTALVHPLLFPVSIGKALATPIVGAIGKKGAEILGLGKVGQSIAGGVGEALFLGWNPKKFQERMGKLYDKARSSLSDAKVFKVNSKPLIDVAFHPDQFIRNIKDPTKAEQWILERSNGLQDSIRDKAIEVEKLWDIKKGFNKHVNEYKGDFKDISRYAKKTNKVLDNMLESYGKKYNPEFLKAYREANEIYKGLSDAPKFVNTLRDAAKKRSDLLLLGTFTGAITIPTIGKALVGLGIAKNVVEAIGMIYKNPKLMKQLGRGIASAGKQNIKSAILDFEKADKILKKEFPGIEEQLNKQ